LILSLMRIEWLIAFFPLKCDVTKFGISIQNYKALFMKYY